MAQLSWNQLVLPTGTEALLYELFHENSKNGRHTQNPSQSEVREHLEHLHPSLPYAGFPRVDLPRPYDGHDTSLFHAIASRSSIRQFVSSAITLSDVATLLYYGYGVTRAAEDARLHRGFRVVPSGGGLYPLELYLHTAKCEMHEAGLYHYNPEEVCIRLLRAGNETEAIAKALLQPEIGMTATILIFITALFERSTFKYQDRGYRYTLLEAGHVAQNLNLVANALGYGVVNIGGFFDREIDDLLGLDGVTQSIISIIAIGKTSAP